MSQKFDNFENQLLVFSSIVKNFNEQSNFNNLKKCYYKLVKDSFEFTENEWNDSSEDTLFLKKSLMLGLSNVSFLTNNLLSEIKYDVDNKNLISSTIKSKDFLNKIENISYLENLKEKEYSKINAFFGANFYLLNELVLDFRKILISSILGYCDSELDQNDLESYFSNKLLSSKIFKYRNQNQSEFIFPKLIDKNIYYFYDTFYKGETFCIAGIPTNINFDINNQYNCSDSFFINEEKNKLSAVLNFKEIDNNSISKIIDLYYALKFTIKNKDEFKDFSYSLNICINPYKISKDCNINKGTILTLFAEENSYRMGKILPHLNINVYGEDTFEFYNVFKSMDYRAAAKLYLNETNDLIQDVYNFAKKANFENFNGKTFSFINNLLLNYLQIFPLEYNEKITDDERKILINISSNLSKLHKEIINTQLYYKFGEEINKINEFSNVLKEENIDLFVFDNNIVFEDNISYEFYDQLYEVMEIENNQFISKEKEKTILTPYLLEKASNFEIAECMDEFLSININLATSENIPQKEKSKEFFIDTRNILSGKVKLNALTSQVNNLTNPSNSFKRWVNSVIIYDVDNSNVVSKSILSMHELFNPQLLEDPNLIPYNNKCKNIFTNVADTMIYTSNLHFGDKLKEDLSRIYKQPKKRIK